MPAEASVAQSVERLTRNEQAMGPIPVAGSMFFLEDAGFLEEEIRLRCLSRFLSFFSGFPTRDRFVLAVSGGVDSMTLLHVVSKMNKSDRERFCVAHVNHQIREESEQEFRCVQEISESWGFQFFGCSRDIPLLLKQKYKGRSLEEVARLERTAFFDEIRTVWNGRYLVTGHHRDDLLETFFMRLFRGSGLNGLDCMKEKEGNILRPLVVFWKKELYEYAEKEQLRFFEDKTNKENNCFRNRIRNEVIPFLTGIFQPEVKEILVRDQVLLSQASEALDDLIEPFYRKVVFLPQNFSFFWKDFADYSDRVVAEFLVRGIKKWKGNTIGIDKEKIDRILGRLRRTGNFEIGIRQNLYFSRSYDTCCVSTLSMNTEVAKKISFEVFHKGSESRYTVYRNEKIIATIHVQKDIEWSESIYCNKDWNVAFMDQQKADFPFLLRGVLEQDIFVPLGMKVSKRLNRFFIDQKIPRIRRREVVLLLDAKSVIIWCVGIRISDTVKITQNTKNIIKIEYRQICSDDMEGRERIIPQFFGGTN